VNLLLLLDSLAVQLGDISRSLIAFAN